MNTGLSVIYHHDMMITLQEYRYKTPPQKSPSLSVASSTSSQYSLPSQQQQKTQPYWNFTWLVFMNEKWVPFDLLNQTKLEQTLTVGGTFVDITDSHFPDVKRVRVFPKSNYLSYLGVKYRLSRIMQPDAYLDHVAIAEAKQDLNNRRAWEM